MVAALTTRPELEVQTPVSSVVGPKLKDWLVDLEAARVRVLGGADREAVHDLRVALRRIRSLLRTVRSVYGRYRVDAIRESLRRVSEATGALRDEEVLGETIDALGLTARQMAAMRTWKARRKQRERALRGAVTRLLRAGALEAPCAQLAALLTLPCNPRRDKEVRHFARRIVLDAQLVVEKKRDVARVEDAVAMHDLRIAYKRLRYAVEAFAPALPPELRAWGQVAARFQKSLGSLHDHDVALSVLERATLIPDATRNAAILAARARRAELACACAQMSEA